MARTALDAITEADTIEEAVGLAIGAGSACWDNLSGAGTFESERAKEISETLVARIREEFNHAPA